MTGENQKKDLNSIWNISDSMKSNTNEDKRK